LIFEDFSRKKRRKRDSKVHKYTIFIQKGLSFLDNPNRIMKIPARPRHPRQARTGRRGWQRSRE